MARLESGNFEISLTKDEAYDLACMTSAYLKNEIEIHWNTLQQDQDGEPLFWTRNEFKFQMMELLYSLGGYLSIYKNEIEHYKRMFSEKRKERASKEA